MWRRVGEACGAEVLDGRLDGLHFDRLHLGHVRVERVQVDLLDDARDALLQHQLARLDERLAVEPLLETVRHEHVRNREQAHALVVRHVGADDLVRVAVVALGRGEVCDAAAGEVHGLVIAVRPVGVERTQLL